jgi:hypothetical protein
VWGDSHSLNLWLFLWLMANDYFRKTKSLYSSTTNSFSTGEGETITPASVVGLPTDTDITLTFDRTVTSKLERIIGQISGSNFVINSGGRGADGTTEQAHTSPTVEYIPNAKDINDMVDGLLVEHNQTGTHKSALVTTLKASAANVTTGTSDTTIATPLALGGLDTKTSTYTNKRITRRAPTVTQSATPTINTDVTDVAHITALAQAITSMTTNLTGTPVEGDTLRIDFTDNGTARAITWGAKFEASGNVALPTTTVLGVRLDVGFVWNSVTSKWRCVAAV